MTDYSKLSDFEIKKRVSELEQCIKQKQKEAVTNFVGMVNDTGQFGWSDSQWLIDFVEEFFEEQASRGES